MPGVGKPNVYTVKERKAFIVCMRLNFVQQPKRIFHIVNWFVGFVSASLRCAYELALTMSAHAA